ncbi:hypothetical protein GGI19_002216 [Coemansia pectinata]|uniref:BTB domain-containing protein n=1 Tax=Coemansia pectinata TaxID=1052879 RepID=A0A9W8LBF9_9FUNG|nr:hypothetical protein GGI19_002216 [Coemansia pectinata]
MPTTENDLTELFIRSFKCSGDVPPALVGSSATYLNGRAYVFGGRALHSGKLSNDIYICDFENFSWRRLELDDNEQPSARFFHSATAYKHFLVVFGGMGLDGDDAASIGATSGLDDRQVQSFQIRTNKTLLGDVAVFDTQSERWVSISALHSDESVGDVVAPPPSPRYAHLATLFGSRLLIVGGQDLDEQYVEELNVFDLASGRWVLRSAFPRAVGLYRSFVASVAGTTLLYSNYSFASVKRALYALSAPPDCTLKEISDQLVGEPPGLRFPRGHIVDPQTVIMTGTLIAADGHSELSLWALDAKPLKWTPVPCGARFRTGSWNQSVVDPRTNTLVLFGDSRRDLTYDYQRRRLNYGEIRTIDLRALGYLRTTQLADPLAGSGFMAAARAAVARTASATQQTWAGKSVAELSFDIGAQFLFFTQFSDSELIANDGSKAAVNSGLLRARWPAQAHMWHAASIAEQLQGYGRADGSGDESGPEENRSSALGRRHGPLRPESSLISEIDDHPSGGPRRYVIDGSREVVSVLLFYLYTDRIDAAARFGAHMSVETAAHDEVATARVLGELLVVARRYGIHKLALRVVNLLRWKVSEATAPVIYEAALRAEHQGLQARCVLALRECIAALRNDRKSSLYVIDNAARASLIRYFPKLNNAEDSEDIRLSPPSAYYVSSSPESLRQRSTSDAHEQTRSAFPSPSQSPASTMRATTNQSRSPYDLNAARRPWDSSAVGASPTINSPSSTRYSASQSPDVSMRGTDPKRLSSVSPLASQPLPEDSAVDYSDSLDHHQQSPHMMAAGAPPGSHRMSRYVAPSNTSMDSSVSDRRPSDSTTIPDTHLSQFAILQQQQQQQQQQAPQSSARSLIFRPWSKMKKIASSSQVSSDSLPPMPSHASSYSGHSN